MSIFGRMVGQTYWLKGVKNYVLAKSKYYAVHWKPSPYYYTTLLRTNTRTERKCCFLFDWLEKEVCVCIFLKYLFVLKIAARK